MAPVTVNKNLFKAGDRRCVHVELDITGSRLKYESGDHVAIYPTNDAVLVQKIGEYLQVDLDKKFSLVNIDCNY